MCAENIQNHDKKDSSNGLKESKVCWLVYVVSHSEIVEKSFVDLIKCSEIGHLPVH